LAPPCWIPAGDTFSSRGQRPRNRRCLKADPERLALRLVGTHNGRYSNGMRPFQGRTLTRLTFRGRCPRLLNRSPAGIAGHCSSIHGRLRFVKGQSVAVRPGLRTKTDSPQRHGGHGEQAEKSQVNSPMTSMTAHANRSSFLCGLRASVVNLFFAGGRIPPGQISRRHFA
jgi:hypothetical protein